MQRIATTAQRRESREQVRATPHPDRTPWLASRAGAGHARDRAPERADAYQAMRAQPGFARPDVQENPAATDAATPSDEVADRVDQALVSDEKQPAKLELSRPTSPGAATSGRGDGALGFAPTAHGTAPVPAGAPGLPDARALALATFQREYDRYLARVRQKVDPLWEFPRELAVRMEQGDVVVGFTIRKDGRVSEVHVLKGSGFDKFDHNVLAAIKKAAPFEPLPATLGAELRVTAPFEGSNPAIR
jgi:protein TonB